MQSYLLNDQWLSAGVRFKAPFIRARLLRLRHHHLRDIRSSNSLGDGVIRILARSLRFLHRARRE